MMLGSVEKDVVFFSVLDSWSIVVDTGWLDESVGVPSLGIESASKQ